MVQQVPVPDRLSELHLRQWLLYEAEVDVDNDGQHFRLVEYEQASFGGHRVS